MSWTDERVALLKKMWGEGKTAAEIAKELGGVTRNAVIGKAHRLKLSNRLSPIQQNTKKPVIQRPAEEKPSPKKIASDRILADNAIKGVSLAAIKDKMCRWPIGDPKEENFRFCGCIAAPGLPYCSDHAAIAYQSPSRSRTLNAEDFEERNNKTDESEDLKEVAVG